MLTLGLMAVNGATRSGLDAVSLWIGFAIMLIGLVSFGVLRLSKATPESRGFYDKSIIIVLIASCAYLAMALNLGGVYIGGETHRVYIPRYIDWLFTTPLLLLDLVLFAKPILQKGWQWDALMIIFFDDVMIVTGLVAALDTPPYRWVWFWVSTAAYVVVALFVINLFRKSSLIADVRVATRFRLLCGTLSVLWLIYPFVWALYFGNLMTPGVEDLVFMLLDITAKVGFGFILLLGPAVELVDRVASSAEQVRGRRQGTLDRDMRGGTPAQRPVTP